MAIDIDVNDRTPPTPCQTEGCDYPRYHACTFGKPDLFPFILGERARKRQTNWATGPKSDATRAAMSESQAARWSKIREAQQGRDEAIVKRYAEGNIGMNALSREFEVHVNGVRKILRDAAAKGLVTIRRQGHNIRHRNPELEKAVIDRYNEGGVGIEPLAAQLGTSRDVVRRILQIAQEEGLTKIRPRGHTVAKGAA